MNNNATSPDVSVLCKVSRKRKLFLVKIEITNSFHHLMLKTYAVECNQVVKDEILAAGDVRPKCKQLNPAMLAAFHVTGRANSDTMEKQEFSWSKSSTQDSTSQVENIFHSCVTKC